MHTHQGATAHTGRGGGVIHLAGHDGVADREVALADAGRHADAGGQHIVGTIAGGGVDAQSAQQHRLAHTHVFVIELPGGCASERHTVGTQGGDHRCTCHDSIGVGVVHLVSRCQAREAQGGLADVGRHIGGLVHRIVGRIHAAQGVGGDHGFVQTSMFVGELACLVQRHHIACQHPIQAATAEDRAGVGVIHLVRGHLPRHTHPQRRDVGGVAGEPGGCIVACIRTTQNCRHGFADASMFVVEQAGGGGHHIPIEQACEGRTREGCSGAAVIHLVASHQTRDRQSGWGDVAVHPIQTCDLVVACVGTRQSEAGHIHILVGAHVFVRKKPCGCAVEVDLPATQGLGHRHTSECGHRGAVIDLVRSRQTFHRQDGGCDVAEQTRGLRELVIGGFAAGQDIVRCDGNACAHVGAGEGACLRQGHVIGVDHTRQQPAGHAGCGGGVVHLAGTCLARDADGFGCDVGGESRGLADDVIARRCAAQAVGQIHRDVQTCIGTGERARRGQADVARVHGQHALHLATGHRGRGAAVIHLVVHSRIGHADRQRVHRVVGRHIAELVIVGVATGHTGRTGCDAETARLRHAGFVGSLGDTTHGICTDQGGV